MADNNPNNKDIYLNYLERGLSGESFNIIE